jgi:hypothetical protein
VSSLMFVVIVQAPWGDGNGVAVVTTHVITPTACMDSFGGVPDIAWRWI